MTRKFIKMFQNTIKYYEFNNYDEEQVTELPESEMYERFLYEDGTLIYSYDDVGDDGVFQGQGILYHNREDFMKASVDEVMRRINQVHYYDCQQVA